MKYKNNTKRNRVLKKSCGAWSLVRRITQRSLHWNKIELIYQLRTEISKQSLIFAFFYYTSPQVHDTQTIL